MTYAPAPYAAPVQMTDPTNVMGRRIGAYFIDVVVPTVIALIVGFSIWFTSATQTLNQPTNSCNSVAFPHPGQSCFQSGSTVYLAPNSVTGRAFLIGFLIWSLAPLNAIVLQGITGATVGKYIFGLRVVRGDGSIAGFGWVLLRSFLFIVDNMCFAIVGLVSSSVTHPHRRVGDMAAGTYVVGKQSVGRPVVPYPAYAAAAPYGYAQPQPSAYGPPPGSYAPPPTAVAPTATAPWTPPPNGAPTSAPADAAPSSTPWVDTPPSGTAPADSPTTAGWAAPEPTQPVPASAPAPADQWRPPPAAYAPPPPVQDPTEPHWDASRNAWIAWEPTRGQWMHFDATTNEWRVM
ncbi:MAG TPA: RDD family protein [Acidimicrobiia bacterium]|jgi:uncharacterized RDD family membrane protein YckC